MNLDADQVRAALGRRATMEALRAMFHDGCDAPLRHHHEIAGPGPNGTMLLMPAWQPGRYLGVKIVNVFPANGELGLPAVQGIYMLFSGATGELLATIDGNELTARRTAAASALAAHHLARPDAATLTVIGTGRLARHLAAAHAANRPIARILVWGRDARKAQSAIDDIRTEPGLASLAVTFAPDLADAVASADIVSCATLSWEPLVRGEWLRPGTHVDLVGGFTPQMREADDEAIRRASVFIDTAGALVEAGDIVVPLATGILAREGIAADLRALVRGQHRGRASPEEITLFKSVGASEEDLAAAILAFEQAGVPSPARIAA